MAWLLLSASGMIDGLFNQANYAATKRLLDATALRQQAISSNIANLETPNYKRIDVDPIFETSLSKAMTSQDTSAIAEAPLHLARDLTATAANRDGNTVQLDREMAALGENTLSHNLETQLLTGSMLRMRLAITGRTS